MIFLDEIFSNLSKCCILQAKQASSYLKEKGFENLVRNKNCSRVATVAVHLYSGYVSHAAGVPRCFCPPTPTLPLSS